VGSYNYTARSAVGKTVRGVMFAQDSHELINSLRKQGLYCMNYKEKAEEKSSSASFGGSSKLKLQELVIFCNQMATMLSAGLTVMAAIDILYNQEKKPRVAKIYLMLYESIQKGDSLSAAMRKTDFSFPEFLINMITSAESTGSLDSIMTQMSEYYEKEKRLRSKISNAMVYPIFLASLSVCIVVGLFVFILPSFFALFNDVELPPLTRVMMAISNFIINDWILLIFGIFLFSAIFMLVLKIKKVRYVLDAISLKIPVLSQINRMVATAKFSRTLATMYASGISMIEALESIARILGNLKIQRQFVTIIDSIKEGDALSMAIKKTNIFEPMLYSMIYIGEETGSLDKILLKTSIYYDAEAENALQKMVALIEPITIVILGFVILLILASILPVVYSMYSSV